MWTIVGATSAYDSEVVKGSQDDIMAELDETNGSQQFQDQRFAAMRTNAITLSKQACA